MYGDQDLGWFIALAWSVSMTAMVVLVLLIPVIIAPDRIRRRIALLTLLTGWTIVGWLVALQKAIQAAEAELRKSEPEK